MRDGGYAWAPVNCKTKAGAAIAEAACLATTSQPDMSLVHRLMDVYERFTAEQIAVSPVDPRGVLFVMVWHS